MTLLLACLTLEASAKEVDKGEDFAGYLFAYFEGTGDGKLQEHLRFAVSEDAQNWYALNDGKPVLSSDSISTSGGIRDPHIFRGPDGAFYLAMTDLHLFTQRSKYENNPKYRRVSEYRETVWDSDGKKYYSHFSSVKSVTVK